MVEPKGKIALASLFGILSVCSSASAEMGSSLHQTGSASVGYNSNAFGAPTRATAISPPHVGVFFIDVRPGVLFYLDSPRLSHRFRYTLITHVFFGRGAPNSISNTVDWSSYYGLSPNADLVLALELTHGRVNTFSTIQGASSTSINALPTGSFNFLSPSFQEGLQYRLSPLWQVNEAGNVGAFRPLENTGAPTTFRADSRLHLDRMFLRDSVGVGGRLGYARSTGFRRGTEVFPESGQIVEGADIRWRRELSPSFSSEIDAGVVRAVPAGGDGASVMGPAGGANLRYSTYDGTAEIFYSRSMQPNLYLGRLFYTDMVGARAGIPVSHDDRFWRHVSVASSVGYQNGRIVDTTRGELSTKLDIFMGDLAITYAPTKSFHTGARYQYFRQKSTPGPAAESIATLATFDRHIVMLTIGIVYPDRERPDPPYFSPSNLDEMNAFGGDKRSRAPDSDGSRGGQ
jgi:hypothetical protein